MKKNMIIIIISVLLYVINNILKESYHHEIIRLIMTGYFNDFVGSIAFVAYCNLLLFTQNIQLHKLSSIVLLMLSCGCFWEFIGPMIRHDTYCDLLDIVVYIIGGITYWFICKEKKIS